jgi:hypothetical protein
MRPRPSFSRHPVILAVLLVAAVIESADVVAAQPPPAPQPEGSGRVEVTVIASEGAVRLAGADVELLSAIDKMAIGKTATDGAGKVVFFDVAPGRYTVVAARPGFTPTVSPPFDVRAAEVAQVLLEVHLTFIAEGVEVRAATPPTESIQPVSTSDMLAGSVLDIAPLEGDDFKSLLPLLPGVVRGPDGRLRAKGGQATQGALQISSTSLIDASTGDFDLELPGRSLESVELLANPFAAEYGRFSTSLVQLRTRRGTNDWDFSTGGWFPRFRKGFSALRGFEPHAAIRGPLRKDRLFLSQDVQVRYVADPIKSLPDEPAIELRSFDSFTRLDGIISSRHSLGGLIVIFPRKVEHITMDTFRPPEAAPDFVQSGTSVGAQDRFGFSSGIVLESTLAVRLFEINIEPEGGGPMIYAPASQRGNFFNDQEREVGSVQFIESLSIFKSGWRGEHLFKFGFDVQRSSYDGTSDSRPIEIRRLDDSLAERIVFGAPTTQSVATTEVALYAQDLWRIGPRITIEGGVRMDREGLIDRINWSPRVGASISVLPEGRAILRGGFGRFRQRTPLNIAAFPLFEPRTITRFDGSSAMLAAPVTLRNVLGTDLRTPEADTSNVEWDQRFGRKVLFKVNYLHRRGEHEYVLVPDHALGEARLESSGESQYDELEFTTRYLGGERRDLSFSYVRSSGKAHLNFYDQFYGNVRNPILRADEYNLMPTDVPHRVIVRGTIGLPGKWDLAPVIELRSGFPWSAVDEFQDFVGERNRAGRLPPVRTFDFSLSRPWHVWKYRFRAGLRVYNIFGSASERDVQNNTTSPAFGQFFNPLERSIGFVFGSAK